MGGDGYEITLDQYIVDADARLIAATPDLLAACETALTFEHGEGVVQAALIEQWIAATTAAIAKTKGGVKDGH